MDKRQIFGLVLIVFFMTGREAAAEDAVILPAANMISGEAPVPVIVNPHKRYLVESGIIEYVISGTQNGIEIAYFDRWGMREARYTRSETVGLGFSNTLTVIDGEWIYMIDLDKRIGNKVRNELLKKALEQSSPGDKVPLGKRMMAIAGGEKMDKELIVEKKCDVWQIVPQGRKFWMWNWIPLKSETKSETVDTTFAAASLQTGVMIPEEKFSIPEGIQFIEGNISDILLSLQRMPDSTLFQ
ncbi:MAG: hypothetical protein A3D10_00200 [Omnitrophica WOR_2 bacterium RIFCSPHIGHO2_02_FULL_48_11]|nr:MAG: hypothetical protein A3D10_00200 [Omnitrophica WOR_2 bacterium RIFCSPHIGHO2_02_FULL_48_11]